MKPVRQSDRAFGITFAVVFAVIPSVGWLVFDAMLNWAWVLSAFFLAMALVAPGALMPLNRLWAGFAHRVGQVSNYLLLGLFFYLLVLPFGLIIRLLGRDPMDRKLDPKTKSYWSPITRRAEAETFRDMF
jgi:hypothetical protein